MSDKTALMDSLRKRDSRSGIVTADRYFREVQGCFDGGVCPIDVSGFSEDEWRKKLKEAENLLTYTNPETEVLSKSISKDDSGLFQFDAIITTPFRDRDGDILLTKGASIEERSPLLWQHIPMQPIGSLVRNLKQTDSELRGRFIVADTELGKDTEKLIKAGALRISHGFEPKVFSPLEDEEGWLFKVFDIYEVSVVSIPSNIQAVITGFDGKAFDSDLVKAMQNRYHKAQNKTSFPVTKVAGVITENGVVAAELRTVEGVWADQISEDCSCKKDTVSVLRGEKCQDFPVDKLPTGFLSFESKEDWEKAYEHWLKETGNEIGKSPEWEMSYIRRQEDENLVSQEIGWRMTYFAEKAYEVDIKQDEQLMDLVSSVFEKAGSRISQSTRTELSEIVADLESIRDMENQSRPVMALAGNALSSISGLMSEEDKSFEDTERRYFAALAKSDTDQLKSQIRRLKLMISASEDQKSARELDKVLSIFEP